MLYQTQARIHLGAIRHNLDQVRRASAPARLLLSVKADAYGHGAVPVARAAQAAGVDWLGVATVPEGLELRAAGIGLPVLKLSATFPEEMAEAVKAGLTLAIPDEAGARALEAACAGLGQRAGAHLKVETGMGRTGVPVPLAPALASVLERECPHVDLGGVFTHLPQSDQADPAWTRAQIARFRGAVEAVEAALGRRPGLVHCANSGAVLNHPEAAMDMVRVGILAYGHLPDPALPAKLDLRPALSFVTRVAFLKRVEAGTPIGYGLAWTAPRDTWIATLACGYADGFDRRFSEGGRVLIGGRAYPVAGRVCMDQTMVDLGPETPVRPGDEAVLIGTSGAESITVEAWARALRTIPYEVTCRISARVPRIPDTL